ncbi:MAG: DUF4861 family protein [Bacteroidales bacterium]|nr:DUF4861 family protein [Bacteroidales bacterium]
MRKIVISSLVAMMALTMSAQTDVSLFWRSDSVQISEIITPEGDQYRKVGHHGPAIENNYMGLRIYFNHSGSIDVYSKQKPQLELASALWYPTAKMQAEGYGCDEYKVGSTVGLGGYNLWDGKEVLKLTATEGREARVKKIKNGAVAEMLAKGVPYKNKKVDILIRITMRDGEREAIVEAFCKKGGKVQFVTGVNFHPGKELFTDEQGHIATWGRHPADVSKNPINIGGGMVYKPGTLEQKKITKNAVLLISKPCKHYKTKIVSAGEREADLNNAEKFIQYVKNLKY